MFEPKLLFTRKVLKAKEQTYLWCVSKVKQNPVTIRFSMVSVSKQWICYRTDRKNSLVLQHITPKKRAEVTSEQGLVLTHCLWSLGNNWGIRKRCRRSSAGISQRKTRTMKDNANSLEKQPDHPRVSTERGEGKAPHLLPWPTNFHLLSI